MLSPRVGAGRSLGVPGTRRSTSINMAPSRLVDDSISLLIFFSIDPLIYKFTYR